MPEPALGDPAPHGIRRVTAPEQPADRPLTRRELRAAEARAAAQAPTGTPPAIEAQPEPRTTTAVIPLVTAASDTRSVAAPLVATPHVAARRRRVRVRFEKAPKRRTSIGRKLFSITALLGAASLLVGMSVPANAFMSLDAAAAPRESVATTGQSLSVASDVSASAPTRDGYGVLTYAEMLRLKYSGLDYTYAGTSGAVQWPFGGPSATTDQYGITRSDGFHKGVDFVPGAGSPIYTIAAGTVIAAGWDNGGYGNRVILQSNLGGVTITTMYTHMQNGSSPIQVGDNLEAGSFVGLVGDTGRAYGANMHFELTIDGQLVDPIAWLTANAG